MSELSVNFSSKLGSGILSLTERPMSCSRPGGKKKRS